MKKIYTLVSGLMLTGMCAFQASAQISTYCASNATFTGDTKVDSVQLQTISHSSGATTCETYTDVTSSSAILKIGQSYTLSVANGSCSGFFYSNNKRAWIDFDRNGQFDDPAERIMDLSSSFVGEMQSNTFSVPASASSGPTYMRVIVAEGGPPLPCGSYNYGETEDFSIYLRGSATDDAGVSKVLEPAGICAGEHNAKVVIENFGVNEITSVEVNWSINGVLQTPFVYSASPLDTIDGTGPSSAIVTLGTVTLQGGITDTLMFWTSSPNNVADTSNSNDTITKIYKSLPTFSTYPYHETFESGDDGWFTGGDNASWAFGTPAKSNIVGAASGVNAFVTGGLSGSYNNNEDSYVHSPCFDLSQIEGEAWVALSANWYSETSYDGAVLQYSVDGGKTWVLVGKFGDPYNWYSKQGISGSPGGEDEGWAGTAAGTASGGWVWAKHALDPAIYTEDVVFRIAFGSDGSVTYDGFAFDDFTIVDFKHADLGPDKLSLCGEGNIELDPNVNFNGTIKWSTGDTINETITVSSVGKYSVTYHDTLLDLSTSDSVELIQSAPPVIGFTHFSDTTHLQGSVTLDPHTQESLQHNWEPGGFEYPFLLVRGADYGVGKHTFLLTVTDSLLCQDQKSVEVVILDITGIEDQQKAILELYPNPVSDILNIQLAEFAEGAFTLQMTDLQGKTIINNQVNQINGPLYRLDVSELPNGIYLMSVYNQDKTAFAKIIVNR